MSEFKLTALPALLTFLLQSLADQKELLHIISDERVTVQYLQLIRKCLAFDTDYAEQELEMDKDEIFKEKTQPASSGKLTKYLQSQLEVF